MIVLVTTHDMKSGTQLTERTIDYRQGDSRSWLEKHISHAVNNGKGVQVCALADENK